MTRMLFAVSAVALLAVACSKPEKSPTPGSESKPASSVPAAASEAAPAETATLQTAGEPETRVAAGEIPTPEDYEEEASNKMAAANLELELDALEAEIGN